MEPFLVSMNELLPRSTCLHGHLGGHGASPGVQRGAAAGSVHPLVCKTWTCPASDGTKRTRTRPMCVICAAAAASSGVLDSPSLCFHMGASPEAEEAGVVPVLPPRKSLLPPGFIII